jgi:hypothetical protein
VLALPREQSAFFACVLFALGGSVPPEPSEPVAPSDASKTERVVLLLEEALALLDSMSNTAHLAALLQGVADELRGQGVDDQ